MPRFSANLGFLWNDRPLAQAIRAAKAAGFHAVECHWPYNEPIEEVRAALEETGLPMLGLNTRRGPPEENGLAALAGWEDWARKWIDEGLDYGHEIGARNLHVMAGIASGPGARRVFLQNLAYACEEAAARDMTILIEPLNQYDAPGYFLRTTEQAAAIIKGVAAPNLKLMFDCYHVQIMEGDLTRRLDALRPIIGHVQFAAVPDRGEPDRGEVSYEHVFEHLDATGYDVPLGAEYRPRQGDVESGLGWLRRFEGSG